MNAADNKIRDPSMTTIKVTIKKDENMIKVYNNGKGIPIVEHKDEKVFVPTLIFGHLLTSSNYDDNEKKVTGGRNGYGAKLCNIFSKKFIVETSCKDSHKYFKQTWSENMGKTQEPAIKPNKDDDFTCVTFYPDLKKFGMETLEDDTIALLAKRAYDIAASTRGVKVYLNEKRLPITKFEDYCKLYVANNSGDENDLIGSSNSLAKIIHENVNPRWEVAVSYSDIGFQQVSFVNSIATTKGGRHVDYVCDQIVKHLTEVINKKSGKNSTQIKPFQIKNHLWLFVNCLIENPVFESQTKECMSLQVKNFGSKCQLSEDFLRKVASKSGIVDRVLNWLAFKEKTDLEKTGAKSKQTKVKGIPKLDDANNAGTKDSMNCTLILTEGDSAKSLAVAGLGVLGRDRYGVFPLRGKMLNVREATTKQILDNAEITSLCKIIGLNFKEKYETRDSMKTLRYGKIMIMTDQDHDGSHIKGLIINFIHHQWPNLLKYGFVEEFITPIIKVFKSRKSAAGNENGHSTISLNHNGTLSTTTEFEKSFFSIPEFEEWQNSTPDWHTWKIKYYKGLGTSTSKEAKEYFSDMNRHCIRFEYSGVRDDLSIQLAFSRKLIEERKDWLTRFMQQRNETKSDYLYQKDTKKINFTDFVNKELVLFSNLDNERSIPNLVDGLKPGQRKVLFACFKRNLMKEIKVAQLAGSVAELSAYHHGEQSLMSTIINLAQNFVGSNNLNLLLPIGQFGTRLHGGKDAASPRYIFTNLNPLTRLLFNMKDDPLFDYLNDDGLRVEPEFYCPIIPMILVNGAEGIGTGWAVKMPNYNVKDLINNLMRMIKHEEPYAMKPFYKNFKGTIQYVDEQHFQVNGECALIEDENDNKNDYTIEITELPVGVWTQAYKESVLEQYLYGSDSKSNSDASKNGGAPLQLINDYKEYHTDCTVRFVVKMSSKQYQHAIDQGGLHKFFKLQKTISLNNMVLFDSNGCLKRYESALEILKEFYQVRLRYYVKRKEYLESMLGAESAKLDNIAKFIMEKIDGKIKVENLKKHDLLKLLSSRGYESDPVRRWKERITKEKGYLHEAIGKTEELVIEEQDEQERLDFNYLLSMPLWNLTLEKKEEILKQQKAKSDELEELRKKTPEKLWLDDLAEFKEAYERTEQKEKEDFEQSLKKKVSSSKSAASYTVKSIYLPAVDSERVEPKIDSKLIEKVEKDNQMKKVKKEDSGVNIIDLITSKEKLNDDSLNQLKEFSINLANPNKAKSGVKKDKVKKENEPDITLEDSAINDTFDLSYNHDESQKTNGKSSVKPKKEEKTPTTTPKKPKEPAKKKEKIVVDTDSELSFSDEDQSNSVFVEKRESNRSRKSIKYNFDESNSEDDDKKSDVFEIIPKHKEDNESLKNGYESILKSSDDETSQKEVKKKATPKAKSEKKAPAKKPADPKPKAKSTPKKAKKAYDFDDDDDDAEEESFPSDEDNDDEDFQVESGKKKRKTPVKKTPTTARATKKETTKKRKSSEFVSDSDESDEIKVSRKKKSIIKDDDDDFSLD